MNTIPDEHCTETMESILETKDYEPFVFGNDIVGELQESEDTLLAYTSLLTKEDKDLLLSYAPKLFNTLKKADDLYGICLELSSMLGHYRLTIHKKNRNIEYNKSQIKREKHNQKDKVNSLKTHIKEVLDLIGKHSYKYHKRNNLRLHLLEAYENPEQYIMNKRDPITPTKKDIEAYLNSLGLPNKSKIIRTFKNKINTNTTPTFTHIS